MYHVTGALVCVVRFARWKAAFPFAAAAILMFLACIPLGDDKSQGSRALFTAVVATIAISTAICIAAIVFGGWRIHLSLQGKPWKRKALLQADPSLRTCPFSDQAVLWTCRLCHCAVGEHGWHHQGKQVETFKCDVPTQWSHVSLTLNKPGDGQTRRQECDSALRLRTNLLTVDLAESCIGCHMSMLCCNALPRLAMTAGFAAVAAALGPYAVPQFVDSLSLPLRLAILDVLSIASILYSFTCLSITLICVSLSCTFLQALPDIDWPRNVPRTSSALLLVRMARSLLPLRMQAKVQVVAEEVLREITRARTGARHSAMSALGNRHSLARSSVSVPESAINLPSSPTGRRMIL